MIVPVMAISNLVLTQQIYSEETNGAHAHYREPVPLIDLSVIIKNMLLVRRDEISVWNSSFRTTRNGRYLFQLERRIEESS